MKYEGIFTALVTPMDEQFHLDEARFRKLIDCQIESGINGLVLMGGTGEYVSLSFEDRKRVVEVAKDEASGRVPVVAGVLDAGLGECIKCCKAFEALGADALLVLTPYYVTPSQEGMIDYFQRVDKEVSTPILIYNIPSRVGSNILPQTIETIVNTTKNVVGVKECASDFSQNVDLLHRLGQRISVLGGSEFLLSSLAPFGVSGGVMATANLFPKMWLKVYEYGKTGKYQEAAALVEEYAPLISALFAENNPGPLKYALSKIGIDVGAPCPPLPALPSESLCKQLDKLMAERGLI